MLHNKPLKIQYTNLDKQACPIINLTKHLNYNISTNNNNIMLATHLIYLFCQTFHVVG